MENKFEALYNFTAKPRLKDSLPVAMQHVLAMVIGCITPALVLSNTAHLNQQQSIMLIQSSLIIAGIATFIQLYLGAKLPVIIGAGFAYLATVVAIASLMYTKTNSPEDVVAYILGGQIVGGLVAIVLGILVKYMLPLFPPLVTGTVVFVIGLSLYPVGIKYMGGNGNITLGWVSTMVGDKKVMVPKGIGNLPAWGHWKYWLVALITLIVVILLSNFTKGITKIASILFAIIVGYIISIPLGLVDFSKVVNASYVPQIVTPFHFGIKFDPAIITSFVILFAVNSVQAIGDFTATTVGGMDRVPTTRELQGGIIAYGATNILAAIFGAPPLSTYSQNVGIVGTNKVINRIVMSIAALIIVLAGVFPIISAIITTIPSAVIGGATVPVFASITMTGIRLISKQKFTQRNMVVVGLSVAIGMGFCAVCEATKVVGIEFIPQGLYTAIGTSPVVLSTLVAIILNLIIRPQPIDIEERPE